MNVVDNTKRQILIILLLLPVAIANGQIPEFTRQDTLRGSITPEREWWDLTYYHLDVKIDPESRTIEGSVTIEYKVLKPYNKLQIDLQSPLVIRRVEDNRGRELTFESEGNAHIIALKRLPAKGDHGRIKVYYGGKPKEAPRPPWDGGISWSKDENGKHRIHSTCQGTGASVWWPCKDHLYDEPDSVLISVNVPSDLMDVSNGRLREIEEKQDGTTTYHWFVNNPISNYVININIADYVMFSEKYEGEKGVLDMDYYVLPINLEKAKKQFQDAPRMMEAFEHWFGPYPFYEDGYKLVDATYYGMEHQSSVTYGNGYTNGYHGTDGSGTGLGFKFDFIIIHESGHEWFANNITYKDMADMWIHESFTNYSESLYLDYHFGKEAGQEYVRGTRRLIRNDRPIIGFYDVNNSGSGDMYVKGGNMLNTIRTIINNDELWRQVLRGLNKTFYHQTVNTEQIEGFISQESGIDLSKVFDQYLRDSRVPVLEYYIRDGQLFYRWSQVVNGFNMPVDLLVNDETIRIEPMNGRWQNIEYGLDDVSVDLNYYIALLRAQ